MIDQEHIKKTLQNAVAQGSFAHAYLLTGPRGTGKTTVARIFARAINCLKPKDGEPDNSCEICKQFLEGRSLDLIEIDAASNTGVENIRDIIEHLKFSPAQAKYKVFIIDEVHMLSKGAFNALLKTLEEPPAHAIFILATTEVYKVPATVSSRTQRFDFHKLDSKKLLSHLQAIAKKEHIEIDEQGLQLVINASEGSGRDALSILDKLASFGKIDLKTAEELLGMTNIAAAQKFLDLLIAKDASGALNFLEKLFSEGSDPAQFNKDFLEYLRKILMHQNNAGADFALDREQAAVLARQAQHLGQNRLLHIIRLFLRANKDFQTSPTLELPLEIAAAESCLEQGAAQNSGGASSSAAAAAVERASASPEKFVKTASSEPRQQDLQPEVKKKPAAAAKVVAFEDLKAAWPKILSTIKEKQSSLLTILKNARLRDIDQGNCLTLALEYKFHKDSLEQKKNADLLIRTIAAELQTEVSLNVILERSEPERSSAADLAMEVFGPDLA